MSAISSYKPTSADSTVPTVTKSVQQKPTQHLHKRLLRGSKVQKPLSPAVRVVKRLKQKSINKVVRSASHGKPRSDVSKVTKPKQRRNRQHRDHVESLIDGLTDYFAAHGERRLKSPALKSISSYVPENHQAMLSQQLDSPTETGKQLLYSSEHSRIQPRKQKKATVEKLFDGLSSFFSVQSEHRRQPTSPITPGGQETIIKNEATSVDSQNGMTSSEVKFSQLKLADRRMMAAGNSQLKGLFDGLSHLYMAHGDRKRISPFFYTPQPTKSLSLASQKPASAVKQESGATGPEVQETSATSQTVKVVKEKQQRMPGKLSTNKLQLSKKSLKPVMPVVRRQLSSSGTVICFLQLYFVQLYSAILYCSLQLITFGDVELIALSC